MLFIQSNQRVLLDESQKQSLLLERGGYQETAQPDHAQTSLKEDTDFRWSSQNLVAHPLMSSRRNRLLGLMAAIAIILHLIFVYFYSAMQHSVNIDSQTHYIMMATKSTDNLCSALVSALVHDAKPIFFDWGKAMDWNEAWTAKMLSARNYIINETKSNDIVIVIDAFDVWLQKPISQVSEDFRRSGHRILFGAEKNCFAGTFGSETSEYKFCTGVPQSPWPADTYGNITDTSLHYNRPRWLNAGTIIGYSKDLLTLYDAVIKFANERKIIDDQALFLIHYYMKTFGIDLDFWGDFIKPLYGCEHDILVSPQLLRSDTPHDLNSTTASMLLQQSPARMVYDSITKQYPPLLHFNGDAKNFMKSIFSKVWWRPEEGSDVWIRVKNYLSTKVVYLDSLHGRTLTWDEICREKYHL